jgi:LysM repeat protein
MSKKDTPQEIIQTYHKRQQMMPFVIGGLAVVLVMIGVVLLIVWLSGKSNPFDTLFPTDTPTVTSTYTVTPETPTSTPTNIPTETPTLTITITPSPSGPFLYTVKENDNCWDLASTFNVEVLVLLAINNFVGCPISPGMTIRIPAPGQELPTDTPIPTGIAKGSKVEYIVKLGDTLASIASKFNARFEDIIKDNKIADANKIDVGQKLIIKLNVVTPTLTVAPTSTVAPETATAQAQLATSQAKNSTVSVSTTAPLSTP